MMDQHRLKISFRWSLCVALLQVSTLAAQSYRGEAVPIQQRTDPVEFFSFRFLTFAFGREGPMDVPLSTSPVMGREYFVEADVSGIGSAADIRFQFLDLTGRSLQTLTMWKASDSSTDGEFYGFVTVPNQPFRADVAGTSTNGVTYRSAIDTTFQPVVNGPPDQTRLPPGFPAAESSQIQTMLNAYRQQLRTRAAQAASDHPNGVIVLPRTAVSAITYEPLISASGATIGMRLRYAIRFPSRQTITAMPHVFPVYQDPTWRGMVAMKPLNGSITPAPHMVGVQTLRDVIVYGAKATYEAGVTYTFTVDLVPDFIQIEKGGRFCTQERKFNNRSVWNLVKSSQAVVPYSVSISDTGTVAQIPAFLPQRTFYESFKSEGASECAQ